MEEQNKTIFRCSQCNRVVAGIEADGICGSPKCRKNLEDEGK